MLRDAIYRSSRAGWSRDQSAHRLWSRRESPNDGEQSPPSGTGSDGTAAVAPPVVGETLIAREIREQRQREEELTRQRRMSTGGASVGHDVLAEAHNDVIDSCAVQVERPLRDFAPRTKVVGRLPAAKNGNQPSVLARYQPIQQKSPSEQHWNRAPKDKDQELKPVTFDI